MTQMLQKFGNRSKLRARDEFGPYFEFLWVKHYVTYFRCIFSLYIFAAMRAHRKLGKHNGGQLVKFGCYDTL